MTKYLFILFFPLFLQSALGQELNCQITVNSQQLQGTNKRVFTTLQGAIFEFMNTTKWTNDVIANDERIDCSLFINVSDQQSTDLFKATLTVQCRRPIYKSSYNSDLMNFTDNEFEFQYVEYQPLLFALNNFSSNLTSVLAFYAYMIIGFDYDAFSLEGGTPHFIKAQTIVNNAQGATENGWKAYGSAKPTQNRYWMVENLLQQTFKPLRACNYNYHRKGLDIMADDKDKARTEIVSAIESLREVHKIKPSSFNVQLFFNCKGNELVNIFSQAAPDMKNKVIQLLDEIDPGNTNKHQRIIEGK